MGYPKVKCISCGELTNLNLSGKCMTCRKAPCRVPGCPRKVTYTREYCPRHKAITDLDAYLARKNSEIGYKHIRHSVGGERNWK